MPFNGSGTYVRPAGQPVVAGTDILDTTFNTYTADVATALTNCITRDGQSPATANLPMGGFKHTGMAAGNSNGDSVRYEQVGTLAIAQGAVSSSQLQNGTFTSFTTGGTATAYTLTPSPAILSYSAGQMFDVTFHIAAGASPTLQISGIASPPNLVRQNADGTYSNIAAGAFPNVWKSPVVLVSSSQALVLIVPARRFTISGTRDVSLATGNISFTGCGFKPRVAHLRANISSTAAWSIGSYTNGGGAQGCIYGNSGGTSANVGYDNTHLGVQFVSAGNYMQIGWSSFDSDGITLTFTKTGSPTGTSSFDILLEE